MRLYRPEDEISDWVVLASSSQNVSMKIEIVQQACDMEVVEAVDAMTTMTITHIPNGKTFFYDVTVLFSLSK